MSNQMTLQKSKSSFNVLLKKKIFENLSTSHNCIELPQNHIPLVLIDDVFNALKKYQTKQKYFCSYYFSSLLESERLSQSKSNMSINWM